MHSIESEIQRLSFERFCENPDYLISELSLIPSSTVQRLCQFASSLSGRDRLRLVRGLYARVIGRNDSADAADLECVERFESVESELNRTWDFLPVSMRQTLQTLLQRTGKIPPQLLSPENGITEEAIRRSERAVLPTARQLKSFLRREFNAVTDWKEPDGATSYCIFETGSRVRFQSLVGCSHGGRVITCFHQYFDDDKRNCQFCLFPYGLYIGAVIFDLVDANSLERLVDPVRHITSAFESLVNRLAL